jgi:hypothetical protein
MRVLANFPRAILCFGIAVFSGHAGVHAQENPTRITLKNGESVELRKFFAVVNCQSTLVEGPVLEVLEGPPELTVTFKEGMLRPQNCTSPVPGGTVVATAKDVQGPKEARLTIRLRFKVKNGDRQSSNAYVVSLFP